MCEYFFVLFWATDCSFFFFFFEILNSVLVDKINGSISLHVEMGVGVSLPVSSLPLPLQYVCDSLWLRNAVWKPYHLRRCIYCRVSPPISCNYGFPRYFSDSEPVNWGQGTWWCAMNIGLSFRSRFSFWPVIRFSYYLEDLRRNFLTWSISFQEILLKRFHLPKTSGLAKTDLVMVIL